MTHTSDKSMSLSKNPVVEIEKEKGKDIPFNGRVICPVCGGAQNPLDAGVTTRMIAELIERLVRRV